MIPKRYHLTAMILHWLMAVCLILMLASGLIMRAAPLSQSSLFDLYQLHKSVGITALLLLLLRVAWRIYATYRKQIPPLPKQLTQTEKAFAKLGHLGLYIMMAALPLSGWFMVSASPLGLPTILFKTVPWPHLPWITPSRELEGLGKVFHYYGALILSVLIACHIGAVVKHKVFDSENLLTRMLPRLRASEKDAHNTKLFLLLVYPAFALILCICIGLILPQTPASDQSSMATKSPSFELQQTQPNTTAKERTAQKPASQMIQASDPYTSLSSQRAREYMIEYDQSHIIFKGKHTGNVVKGQFEQWSGQIFFSPDNLTDSKISVQINLASATTGSSMFDNTLSETDWFSIQDHPYARFHSQEIYPEQPGTFRVIGSLTLKGIEQPLSFDFHLSDLNQVPVRANASFELNRLIFEIGLDSDPKAQWVDQMVEINLEILAHPITE